MLTLAQVQNSSVGNIAGVNVTSPQFISYINDACEILMNLGDWWATVVQLEGLMSLGCVTWPRKIDTVLAMNIGRQRMGVTNFWFTFNRIDGQFQKYLSRPEWFAGWGPVGGFRNHSVVEFSGTQCLFAGPSQQNPFALQITNDSPGDYGKFITIYGYDTNGQEVVSTRSDGTIQKGIQLTLSAVPPNTVTIFSTVTSITKDVTTADVKAWSYVAGQGAGSVVGVFGGGQTSPEFQFSRIPTCNPNCVYHVSALVKLAFEAVGQPADILSIGNLEAIKMMVQAIKKREAGDDENGDKFEATAIRRLNMELNNRFPLDQIVLQNNTFNEGCYPHRRIY